MDYNVDWRQAPDWACHHAFDLSGAGRWHETKPILSTNIWQSSGRSEYSGYRLEWEDSLISISRSIPKESSAFADESPCTTGPLKAIIQRDNRLVDSCRSMMYKCLQGELSSEEMAKLSESTTRVLLKLPDIHDALVNYYATELGKFRLNDGSLCVHPSHLNKYKELAVYLFPERIGRVSDNELLPFHETDEDFTQRLNRIFDADISGRKSYTTRILPVRTIKYEEDKSSKQALSRRRNLDAECAFMLRYGKQSDGTLSAKKEELRSAIDTEIAELESQGVLLRCSVCQTIVPVTRDSLGDGPFCNSCMQTHEAR